MPKILVIIPAYNEEEAILSTVQNLKKLCPQADYVVINDCSRDNTRQLLRDNGIRHIDLPLNLGIGGGVQTGYKYAREMGYDIAIQFDGDGQHRADFILPLIQPILEGKANMTIGSRFCEGSKEGFQTTGMRRLGIRIIRHLIRLTCGITIYDTTSGFRACDRSLIRFFADNYAQDYPEPEAIVTAHKAGFRVQEVPVLMCERQGGVTSIRAWKSIHYMIKVSLALLLCGVRRKEVRKS